MALINTGELVQNWTSIAADAIVHSTEIDVSANYETTIHIQAGLVAGGSANDGTIFIVQTSWNTTGDEDWHEYDRFTDLTGTAQVLVIDATEAAGQTEIGDASTAMPGTGFWCMWKDDTAADSELVFISAVATNTFTLIDGITNEKVPASSDFFAPTAVTDVVAFSSPVKIQGTNIKRARVVIDNNDSTVGVGLLFKLSKTITTSV